MISDFLESSRVAHPPLATSEMSYDNDIYNFID